MQKVLFLVTVLACASAPSHIWAQTRLEKPNPISTGVPATVKFGHPIPSGTPVTGVKLQTGVNSRSNTSIQQFGTKPVRQTRPGQLGVVDVEIKTLMNQIQKKQKAESDAKDALERNREHNSQIEKNLDRAQESVRQGSEAITDVFR